MANHQTQDNFGSIPIADSSKDLKQEKHPAPAKDPRRKRPFSRRAIKPKNRLSFWLKFIVTVLATGSALYLLAGFLLFPYMLSTIGAKTLAAKIGRPVTVGHAEFNPLNLKLTLSNTIIGPQLSNPDDQVDPLLSFGELTVDLELLSLRHQAVICRELTIKGLFLHLVREHDKTYNLLTTINKSTPSQLLSLIPEAWRHYSLNNIMMTDSDIIFDDLPTSKTHKVEEIYLALPSLANIDFQDSEIEPHFSANINGSQVALSGQTEVKAGAMVAHLDVIMDSLDIASYAAYFPSSKDKEIKGMAAVDLELTYALGPKRSAQQLNLTGTVVLNNFTCKPTKGESLTLDSATIKGRFTPLTGLHHVEELTVIHPIIRTTLGNQKTPFPKAHYQKMQHIAEMFDADHLTITSGELLIGQLTKHGTPTRWQNINLSIDRESNSPHPSSHGQKSFAISANGPGTTRINCQGISTSQSSEGLIVINNLAPEILPPYYIPDKTGFTIKGKVNKVETAFNLKQDQISLQKIKILANDLHLFTDQQLAADFNQWRSKNGSFNSSEQRLNLGQVKADKSHISIFRNNKGEWSVPLFAAATTKDRIHLSMVGLDLTNSELAIEDNLWSVPLKFSLKSVKINVPAISASKETPFTFAAEIDGSAPIQADGTFSLPPFAAKINLNVKNLPASALQPITSYYSSSTITGLITADGNLTLPAFSYRGSLTVKDFSLHAATPLIEWQTATADNLALSTGPFSLSVGTLTMDTPFITLSHSKNDRIALAESINTDWPPPKSDKNTPLVIEQIKMTHGSVSYIDRTLKPPFSFTITGTTASIDNFAYALGPVNFSMTGSTVDKAKIVLNGRIKPFAKQPILNFNGGISGAQLKTVSPYLEPLWGYRIQRGSFDLQSDVKREGPLVSGLNEVTVRGLKLGAQLEEQARTGGRSWRSLPLLQALLEDDKELIEVALPIKGESAKTPFQFAENLKKSMDQLLLKATVAPTILLNSKELGTLADRLDFKAGTANLTTGTKKQLINLSMILKKRPLLGLDITGFADRKLDKQAFFDDRTQEIERRQLRHEARLSQALSSSYGREIIEQPSPPSPTGVGTDSGMRQPATKVTNQKLLNLANQRSQVVKDFLTAQGIRETRLLTKKRRLENSALLGRSGNRVDIRVQRNRSEN